MPTESDFLREIATRPDDAVLRLIYADWLDEHPNPRGRVRAELIRIEVELWTQPVFADRYWALKPRRNELRRTCDAEWLAALGYGTGCDPVHGYSPAYETVFVHGIPDGWKERWRLIRAFTEVWYGKPVADVGVHTAEIATIEKQLARTLLPAVREWVAFGREVSTRGYEVDVCELPGFDGYAIARYDYDGGRLYQFVRAQDAIMNDPPLEMIYSFEDESIDPPRREYRSERANHDGDCVTTFVLNQVVEWVKGAHHFYGHLPDENRESFVTRMKSEFPAHVRILDKDVFEAPELLVKLTPTSYPSPGLRVSATARKPSAESRETIPAVFWEFVSATAKREARSPTSTTCAAGFCEAFDREIPSTGRNVHLIDE